uniref:Uncharacterized protein n=1 Tax=Arundo donax TaxID=35708 RepID=A0A0A8ZK85_ARUDO
MVRHHISLKFYLLPYPLDYLDNFHQHQISSCKTMLLSYHKKVALACKHQ